MMLTRIYSSHEFIIYGINVESPLIIGYKKNTKVLARSVSFLGLNNGKARVRYDAKIVQG